MSSTAVQTTKASAEMDAWAKKMDAALTAAVMTTTLPAGRGHRVQEVAISALERTAAAGHTLSRQQLGDALKKFGEVVAHQQQCLDVLCGHPEEDSEDPEDPEVEAVMRRAAEHALPNFRHVGR
jgi:uncharacterized protein (DUF58 family)